MRGLSLLLMFAPGAFVLGAIALVLLVAPDATVLAQASRGYPYVALLAAALIGARMQSARLFVAALALAATYIVLQPSFLGSNILAQALFATFLPIGLALDSFVSDAGAGTKRVRIHAALGFGPLLAAAFFTAGRTSEATSLLTHEVAIGVSIVALLVLAVNAVRSRRAPEAGLAWLTLAIAAALSAPTGSTARGLWVLGGALVLLIALVESAYAMAFHDELTGLPTRRALKQALAGLAAPYAIALVDVDHFKSFNDRYGHDVGDQVLRMVASRLGAVGGGGQAFRNGGEEFVIVFAESGKPDVLPHVEDVRARIAGAAFALRTLPRPSNKKALSARGKGRKATDHLQVTVSVGVAGSSANKSAEDVMKAADKAMYRAKEEGRNRVVD